MILTMGGRDRGRCRNYSRSRGGELTCTVYIGMCSFEGYGILALLVRNWLFILAINQSNKSINLLKSQLTASSRYRCFHCQ